MNWKRLSLPLLMFLTLSLCLACSSGDDASDGDESDGDTDRSESDGDADAATDGDADSDDAEEPDTGPLEGCALPRDFLVGSCTLAGAACYEYYDGDSISLRENCRNVIFGLWDEIPCEIPSDLFFVGVCRLSDETLGRVVESRWTFTPEQIPKYVAGLHEQKADICETLTGDSGAWCSFEDGGEMELDCSRKPAPGVCDPTAAATHCKEYQNLPDAQSNCSETYLKTNANCPTEGLVGWCNNIRSTPDIFYYDAAEVTEDVISGCNGWCLP